ncbi:MAG: rhodanese-like domain-containing protein [Flavobacteriaceae bacterium]|nr:rhodanese-like domain-containing protein [Flavobacteriaceae bacterium]
MSFFGLFGKKPPIEEYLKEGAVIVDVRGIDEYRKGHIEGSKNIPLHTLPMRYEEITSLNKKIICVCLSGGRSGQATSFLKSKGADVINGGPWQNVDAYM